MKTRSINEDTTNISPSKNVMDFNTADSNSLSKLESPKKGRIYRGPNFNAYNRESLGSIPGKHENILVRVSNIGRVGFSSGIANRFSKDINLSPGPASYNTNQSSSTNKESFSSKGYCNGFVSKSERFDNLKEFNDKFNPGPGQYNNSESCSLFNQISKSINYKNLYEYSGNNKSLKVNVESPGPGDYDLIASPPYKKIEYSFNKKPERFFKLKQDIFPGPGKYNDIHNSEFFIPDKDKHTSNFFKKPYYNEREKHKEELLMGNEIEDKNWSPGVGEYDIKSLFGRNNNFNNQNYKMIRINNFETKNNDKTSITRNDNYYVKSSFDGRMGYDSIFKSVSPKIKELKKNHIPGPAYYNAAENDRKFFYNYNIDNKWI